MEYVLILGATSDIAKPISELYAKAGYNLYLAGRNIKELNNCLENIDTIDALNGLNNRQ